MFNKWLTKKKIKTLSLRDIADAVGCQEELAKYASSENIIFRKSIKFGPSYNAYVSAQNTLSVLAEYFFNEDRFSESLLDIIENAQNLYKPEGPPMSPLTNTYFSYWMLSDARYKKCQTFAEYVLKNAKALKFYGHWIQAIQNLTVSRLGIYEHLGFSENKIILKELVTENEMLTINAAGYHGNKGDLLLTRVAMPITADDVHVTLSTPYILCGHSKQEWIDYFERQGISKGATAKTTMNHFMKHWPSDYYWHEFIFLGYMGCETSHIYLKGIPDIRGSKPHENLEITSNMHH